MKVFFKSVALAATGLVLSFNALATNGIFPIGNGMVSHGLGGAGVANGAEASSAVDNPALLSQVSNQYSVGFSLFNPNRSADVGGGYVESDNTLFVIPLAAYTASIDSKMDWGVLVNPMGGMNTDYPAALVGTTSGVDLMGLVIAPSMSYKLDNKTSVGASLLIGYEKLKTDGAFGGANSDDAFGWGIKLGVVSKVSDSTSVGFTYQSQIKMDEMDTHCNAGILSGVKAMGYDCDLSMPEVYVIGVNHQLNTKTKLVADIMQANWSGVDVVHHGFGWNDQTIYKIGVEYQYSTELALRVGLNHGASPIPDSKVGNNVPAPAVTEDHLAFGFTKTLRKGLDLTTYYSYVLENEQVQQGAPAPRIKMDQNVLGVGWNWKY